MKFFSWRSAILKSQLPSTTKLVLLVLSTYMDDHGGGAFPSMETIAENSGLSKRSVVTQIGIAVEAGFVEVTKHGYGGQKWARNEYRIAFPRTEGGEPPSPPSDAKPVKDVHHLPPEGGEGDSPPLAEVVNVVPEGGETDDTKVVKDVHSISPVTSPKTSPENTTTVVERARDRTRGVTQMRSGGLFPMPPDWTPREHFPDLLFAAGLPASFDWQPDLPEFIAYWAGTGQRLNQAQWESKFRAAVLRNAVHRATQPTPLPADWVPSPEAWDQIVDRGIDLGLAERELPAFTLFWRDDGSAHRSWNTKFIEWVDRVAARQLITIGGSQ